MKRSYAMRLVRKFEDAVREDEMRGSFHPDIRDDVHDTFKAEKEKLVQRLIDMDQPDVRLQGL